MTQTPPVDEVRIAEAVRVLEAGGLVAMPTETVYGLAADADNESAVLSTYAAKGRPADHPLIVHVAGIDAISHWAEDVPPEAWLLAKKYWPGPLTLVLKKKARCGLWVTGGQDTVALRCPSHPWAHALISAFSGPTWRGLTAPSANTFGRISPSCAAHVAEDLGVKPEGKLDMILDGGSCEFGIESTMINLSQGRPTLLRHGVVTREMLEETLGFAVPDAGKDAPRASGRLKSHYAPRTKLELVSAEALPARFAEMGAAPVAVMASGEVLDRLEGTPVLAIKAPADLHGYGRDLYDNLHRLDRAGAERILVELPPQSPDWAAVNDRLGRAAAGGERYMNKIYCIKNCGSVKKALEWFVARDLPFEFHDFRKEGIDPVLLDEWIAKTSCDVLLTRKGLLWRKLDKARREAVCDNPEGMRALMLENPVIIKRPVIVHPDGSVTVGVDEEAWERLAG